MDAHTLMLHTFKLPHLISAILCMGVHGRLNFFSFCVSLGNTSKLPCDFKQLKRLLNALYVCCHRLNFTKLILIAKENDEVYGFWSKF